MRETPFGRPCASLAVVVILVLATGAAAQDWKGRARIQGTVVAEDTGEPIEGATVTLRLGGADSDVGPEPVETNKKGRWSFLGLSNGSWSVVIEHPDYVTSEGTAPVSDFGEGRNRDLFTRLESMRAILEEEMKERLALVTARLDEGNRLLGERRFEEARQEFEGAIAELDEASQPMVLIAIARTYYQEEKVQATITTLERVLAIEPNHVEALRLISSLLVSEGRAAEAEPYLARLPDDAKLDPNALLNVGIEKYNNGDLEGALAEFDTVVRNYPDFADAYYYRGLVHLNQSNNEQAIADLKQLLELAPDHANAGEAKQFLDYLESQ